MQFVILLAIGFVLFAAVEFLWVRYVAKLLYRSYIGHLEGSVQWAPLMLFYLIFTLGLTFFATNPAVMASALWYAPVLGALYGFFMYSAHNLLSHASLRAWPLGLTILDIVWGTLAGAVVALATYGAAGFLL